MTICRLCILELYQGSGVLGSRILAYPVCRPLSVVRWLFAKGLTIYIYPYLKSPRTES